MHPAENVIVAGRFRLTRLIGQGGMGSVWQAMHLGLDIPCAVKFIEGDMARVPELQTRFEREAKAAAQLRSPHVVQILDHGVWDGTPYIAMELLDGEDLGKRFAKMGCMPPALLHMYIAQVCRALAKAHAMGIVHRDLKPDNIFLVRDDDREIAKVLDFGIAKTTRSEVGGSNTKTGAMLGTPYYMSPEQAQGTKTVDYRADLWSLAVIVFQGLTGRLPFESEALGDLLMKIMVTELPVPSAYGCPLPGLDLWWRKAASRDPAQRFQSAKEFAESLAVVCQVSGFSGVRDLPHMHAAPAAAAQPPQGAYPVPGPATGVSGTTRGATPSPMSRTPTMDAAGVPKKSALPWVALGFVVVLGAAGGGVWLLRSRGGAASAHTGAPPSAETASSQPAAPATPPPATSATTTAAADAAPPPSVPSAVAVTPSAPPPASPEPHGRDRKAAPPPAPGKSAPASTGPKPQAPADLGF